MSPTCGLFRNIFARLEIVKWIEARTTWNAHKSLPSSINSWKTIFSVVLSVWLCVCVTWNRPSIVSVSSTLAIKSNSNKWRKRNCRVTTREKNGWKLQELQTSYRNLHDRCHHRSLVPPAMVIVDTICGVNFLPSFSLSLIRFKTTSYQANSMSCYYRPHFKVIGI